MQSHSRSSSLRKEGENAAPSRLPVRPRHPDDRSSPRRNALRARRGCAAPAEGGWPAPRGGARAYVPPARSSTTCMSVFVVTQHGARETVATSRSLRSRRGEEPRTSIRPLADCGSFLLRNGVSDMRRIRVKNKIVAQSSPVVLSLPLCGIHYAIRERPPPRILFSVGPRNPPTIVSPLRFGG